MAKAKMRKCHICNVRPASTERGYCHNCNAQYEAEKRRRRPPVPFRYVTYRGLTISFLKGDGEQLRPQFCGRNPDNLPKRRLINLNEYCRGYTREQVKKLKRLCLSFEK